MSKFTGDAEIEQLGDRIAAIVHALETQEAGGPGFLQSGKLRQTLEAASERVKELQGSERKLRGFFKVLRAALESIREGVLIIDMQGRLVYFNCAAEKLLKIDKEETLEQWLEVHEIRELGSKTAIPREKLPFARVLAGQSIEQDLYILRKGAAVGTFLKLSSLPITDPAGGVQAAAAIFTDISKQILDEQVRQSLTAAQKRVAELTNHEAKLGDEVKTLGATVETFSEGVAVLDAAGNFVFANEAAEKLLGVKRTGSTLDQILNSLDFLNADRTGNVARNEIPLVRALAGEKVFDEEMYVQRKGDSYGIWLKVCAQLIGAADAKAKKIAFVFYDVTQQKLDEHLLTHLRRLEESGRKARLTLQKAENAFLAINDQGRITEWNDRAEAMFGWSAAEAIGALLKDTLVPARTKPAFERVLQAFATAGEPTSFNKRLQLPAMHRDGRELMVELSIYSINWEGVYELCAFPQDVTLRNREENRRAIRYNIARLIGDEGTIATAIPKILQSICMTSGWDAGIVWHVEKEEQIVRAREVWRAPAAVVSLAAWSESTVFKRGEGLPGKVWADKNARWIDELTPETMNLGDAGAKIKSTLLFAACTEDSDVLAVVQLFSTLKKMRDPDLLVLFQDIGRQLGQYLEGKLAVDKLKHLDGAIANAHDTVTQKESEIEKLKKKISSQLAEPVVVKNDSDEVDQLKKQIEVQAEVLKRANELEVQKLKEKLLKQSEEMLHITEELESLKSKRAAAQDPDYAIKTVLPAALGREIRTPMNAIIGLSDILARTTALNEEQRDFTNLIHDSGAVLLGVFDDILELSKIEDGEIELEREEFSLQSVVEQAASNLASRAAHKKVSLFTFIAPEVPAKLRGDRKRLLQVVSKLAEAALNLTERGGVVMRATLQKTVDDKAVVRVSLTDTGTGLASSSARLAYKLVTQTDTRRNESSELGLTIARRLVELMGGDIGMESDVGAGATFWFSTALEQLAEDVPPVAVPGPVQKMRVLVVDGPAGASRVIAAYCAAWGIHCDWVLTGEEALSVLDQGATTDKPYDIMIMEKIMFGMNGFALAKSIRDRPLLDRTKLILHGPYGEGRDERLATAGFSRLIKGPLKQSVLLEQLVSLETEIRLQEEKAQAAAAAGLDRTPLKTDKSGVILLAEDNVISQKVALLQLNELGYAAHVVSNGQEAVQAMANGDYKLVLMDCDMPVMTGLEAAEKIRRAQKKSGKHVPIIAVTANADRDQCFAAGMDDYIGKPVETETLRAMLSKWIPDDEIMQAEESLTSFLLAGDVDLGYYPALTGAGVNPRPSETTSAGTVVAHLEPVRQFAHLQHLDSLSQSFSDAGANPHAALINLEDISQRRSRALMDFEPGTGVSGEEPAGSGQSRQDEDEDGFEWNLDEPVPDADVSSGAEPVAILEKVQADQKKAGVNNKTGIDKDRAPAAQESEEAPNGGASGPGARTKNGSGKHDSLASLEDLLNQAEAAITARDAAARKRLAQELETAAGSLGAKQIVTLSSKLRSYDANEWKKSKSTMRQLRHALQSERDRTKPADRAKPTA